MALQGNLTPTAQMYTPARDWRYHDPISSTSTRYTADALGAPPVTVNYHESAPCGSNVRTRSTKAQELPQARNYGVAPAQVGTCLTGPHDYTRAQSKPSDDSVPRDRTPSGKHIHAANYHESPPAFWRLYCRRPTPTTEAAPSPRHQAYMSGSESRRRHLQLAATIEQPHVDQRCNGP